MHEKKTAVKGRVACCTYESQHKMDDNSLLPISGAMGEPVIRILSELIDK